MIHIMHLLTVQALFACRIHVKPMGKIFPHVWVLTSVNQTGTNPKPHNPTQYTEGVFIIARAISKVCFCMTIKNCHTKTCLAPPCCSGVISSKVGNQKKVCEGSLNQRT